MARVRRKPWVVEVAGRAIEFPDRDQALLFYERNARAVLVHGGEIKLSGGDGSVHGETKCVIRPGGRDAKMELVWE